MKPVKLRFNRQYRGPTNSMTFGAGPGPFQEANQEVRYFAFTSTRGVAPRVFEYEDDPDGVEALSNLIRGEDVLALVHGHRVQVAQASLVELSIGKRRVEHRLQVG